MSQPREKKSEFYSTRDIHYRDCGGTFGAVIGYPGPIESVLNFNHKVIFTASKMKEFRHCADSMSAPCWEIASTLILEHEKANRPIKVNVPVAQGISIDHAKQFLHVLQDECVRDNVYAVTKAIENGGEESAYELSESELSGDILKYTRVNNRRRKTGWSEYLDGLEEKKAVFPYVMMSRQVLTDFFSNDDFDDDEELDDYVDEEDSDNEESFEEQNDYRPMKSFDWSEFSRGLNDVTAAKLKKSMEAVRAPKLFVAQFRPHMDVAFTEEGIVNKLEPSWVLSTVEESWTRELIRIDSLEEVITVMQKLEDTILRPWIDKDAAHQAVEEMYNYHPSRWLGVAGDFDARKKDLGLKL